MALVAGGLLAFANSIDLPFVFDDQGAVLENPNLRRLWPLSSALGAPVQSPVAGRPVVSLSLALNHALSGVVPAGYHAWNLGVHLIAALVLFGIVRRTLTSPRLSARFGAAANGVAFACALLWMAHPLQTEVIDYVTQRTESTMGLFFLLTLYFSIRAISARDGRTGRWEAAAVVACALGMASKESMATAPLMVLAYDAVFHAGGLRGALRARPRLYTGLSCTWIVLGLLIAPGPRFRSAGLASGMSPWTYFLNQPEMIATYLRLAVWPTGQVLDYGVPRTLAIADVLPYAVPVLLLFAASVAAWKWRPEVAFLGLWFFVTLAPSSSIVPIATEVGAERRMYLPSIALVAAAVAGVWLLLDRRLPRTGAPRWRRMAPAVCLLCAYSVLTVLTIRRNAEYRDPIRIWETVLERRPHGRAHHSLAIELKQAGRRDEAVQHYRLALTDTPEAHYAVGFELDADGKYDEAIGHYREFLRLLPDDQNAPRAYFLLGRALTAVGRLDEAASAFRQVLRMRPQDVDAHAGLARVFLRQERFDEAIVASQRLIGLAPRNATAYADLGIALVGRDREEEAAAAFTRAVELDPNDPGLRHNLGNALAAVGRLDDAVVEYRRALALRPGDAPVHHALGMVLGAQGHAAEAVVELRRALDLNPADAEARADLAEMLRQRGPAR